MALMNFAMKCKGSISLFLTIILLPTLTFTGLMVDSANLALSKPVVENAGDLTTNAMLANYDTVLRDVYGLMALSQATETSMEAEQYFNNSLKAQSLLESVTTAVSGLNEDIKDFLGVDDEKVDANQNFLNVSYENFNAQGVPGSSLRNYRILKNQIVEFMKYRGPAEIVMDIFGATATFEAADKKLDVTTAKTDVDAATVDLGALCRTLYNCIAYYDSKVDNFKKVEKGFFENVPSMNEKIKKVNTLLIVDVINAVDFSDYEADFALNEDYDEKDFDEIAKYELGGVSSSSGDNFESLKNSFNSGIPSLQQYISSLSSELARTDLTSAEERALFSKLVEFNKKLQEVMAIYERMAELIGKNSYNFNLTKGEDEEKADFNARVKAAREEAAAYIRESASVSLDGVYSFTLTAEPRRAAYEARIEGAKEEAKGLLAEVIKWYVDYYDAAKYLAGVDGKKMPESLFTTKSEYKRYKNNFSNSYDYLVALCNDIKAAVVKLQQENSELEAEAIEYGDNAGQDEYYNEIMSEVSKNKITFDASQLNELITQISANKAYVVDGILAREDDYKLYNKEFSTIAKATFFFNKTFSALKDINEQTPLDPNKCDEYYDKYFPTKFYSQKGDFTSTSYLKKISEAGVKAGSETVNVPAFYAYLVGKYGVYGEGEQTDEAKNTTENISSINESGKNTATSDEGVNNSYALSVFDSLKTSGDVLGVGEIDSISGDNQSAILRQFSSIGRQLDGLFGMFRNGWSGFRDNLLVAEYIMQNFSYATIGAEDEEKGEPSVTTTNEVISPNNNKIYGCEIEYILEGYRGRDAQTKSFLWWTWTTGEADGPEQNVKIVKVNIFIIRFILNTIFALTSSQLRNETYAPAVSLQAATLGVVPYKVWQVILQITLGLCETIYDLNHLMKGEELPIYKSDDNWVFSFSGLANTLCEEAGDYVAEKLEDGMNKLIDKAGSFVNELITGTGDFLVDKLSEEVYTKVGDELSSVVKEQLDNVIGSMGEVVKNLVEEEYLKIVTMGLTFDREAMKNELETRLGAFYDEKCGTDEELKSTLKEITSGLVKVIMNSKVVDKLAEESKKLSYDVEIDNFDTKLTLDGKLLAELLNGTTTIVDNYVDSITNELVNKATQYTQTYVDKWESEITAELGEYSDKGKEWSAEKSELLGEKVDTFFNDTFSNYTSGGSVASGVSGVDDSSSFLGKLINFSYKDYLRIFLFLGISSDEEAKMITRVADVIEMNVKDGLKEYYAKKDTVFAHPAGASFSMSNAFTYIKVNAIIKVKPLLLSQSVFANGSPINFWSYEYSNAQGY